MNDFLRLLIIVALTVSAGCAEFTNQPLAPGDTAAWFESRSMNNESFRQFLETNLKRKVTPWPPEIWDFEMLTQAALYYHPDLDLARAQREIAEAGEITAAQRPNPSIMLSPTYVTHITAAPFNPCLFGVNPNIPIETAGKRDYRIVHARRLTESARLKIATSAWLVRSRLRTSLLNLYAAEKTEALRAEQLAQQKELVGQLEERLAVGEISRPGFTVGRLALEQFGIAWHDARQQAAVARVQLADALGMPVTALADMNISFEALERLAPIERLSEREMRRQALLNRTDILSALADNEASQTALPIEVAKQFPDLQLGASLTLPLLNQNEGPIAEAEAHCTDAAARFRASQAQIFGEIDRTSAGVRTALQKLSAAEESLNTQTRQRQSVEAMVEAGETDRVALVSAHLEFATTALARFDALIQAQQAVGLLEDALQMPVDAANPDCRSPQANSGRSLKSHELQPCFR